MRRPESFPRSVMGSWRRQPLHMRLLRAFLGVTFVYAGVQKLADPGFFRPGAATYIGTQLTGYAQGSPIGPILRVLSHVATPVGWLVALAEIAVGLATLLGIGVVLAAALGCAINVLLLLSATWHVHPYFLGSDSIYAVAWLVYLLAAVEKKKSSTPSRAPRVRARQLEPATDRRAFLRAGAVAVGTIVVSSLSRAMAGKTVARASTATLDRSPLSRPSAVSSSSKAPSPHRSRIAGRPIADLDTLKVGRPIAFDDHGTPAVLFRTGKDSVEAFSRVCTHAGCTVGFNPQTGLLQCPCHGAEFDPRRGAAVVAGPAPTPLPSINVAVDPATRKVVLRG